MPLPTPFRLAAVLAAVSLAVGCRATGTKDDASAATQGDTAGAAAVGGMTDAQIQEQARAVSPDQAREMGIPDSSTLPGSANEVSDSVSSPATQPDSAAAAPPPAVPAKPGARRDRPNP